MLVINFVYRELRKCLKGRNLLIDTLIRVHTKLICTSEILNVQKLENNSIVHYFLYLEDISVFRNKSIQFTRV